MKIASVVDSISMSQMTYDMIKSFNSMVSVDCCVCCFYLNIAPIPVNTNFGLMNAYYISPWDDMLIATSLQTAKVIESVSIAKKFLYLYDLEWLRYKSDYESNLSILKNKELQLLCRNEDHALAIKNYCGVKPEILQDWNPKQLREIYERTRNSQAV